MSQNLQDELGEQLQQLSDLSVEAARLAEIQPGPETDVVSLRLQKLRDAAEQLRLTAAQRQEELKAAVKESERKRRDLQEYQSSVDNLQKWMEENKDQATALAEIEQESGKFTDEQKGIQEVTTEPLPTV